MTATSFRSRISDGVNDKRVVRAVKLATLQKVAARSESMNQLEHPDAVRSMAASIKQHTLDHLPDYLEQFASQVERNGGRVHFAADAAAARRIICDIAASRELKLAVKSKSMTTEEIHLNRALEDAGVEVVETDLGEFIVQLDRDTPSHIVTPIIHKDRRQVAQTMHRELGCEYTEDPTELTMIARRHLREIFRRCDLGISGVNFAVAQTGTLCICTNEGNGRLTVTRPRVHIALMGIEKLIPRLCDLPPFLKLLARSATGQPLTVYTSLITGPKRAEDLDGPEELHVVLMDAGRSEILCSDFREVLRCIRCGACLNVCPVYRNIGGHAYGSVYPGPIGALVSPLLSPAGRHEELPRASSLCGACGDVCPVNIDIPGLLVKSRARDANLLPWRKRFEMRLWKRAMCSPWAYRLGQALLRRAVSDRGDGWTSRGFGPIGEWTRVRDLPRPPKKSFRSRWKQELRDGS